MNPLTLAAGYLADLIGKLKPRGVAAVPGEQAVVESYFPRGDSKTSHSRKRQGAFMHQRRAYGGNIARAALRRPSW